MSERLRPLSFRVDDETFEALKKIETAVGDGVVAGRRRSIAIREAILEKAARLAEKPPRKRTTKTT